MAVSRAASESRDEWLVRMLHESDDERERLRAEIMRLREVLEEIADGCVNFRPGHVNYGKNRTKAEIGEIARAALLSARGEA